MSKGDQPGVPKTVQYYAGAATAERDCISSIRRGTEGAFDVNPKWRKGLLNSFAFVYVFVLYDCPKKELVNIQFGHGDLHTLPCKLTQGHFLQTYRGKRLTDFYIVQKMSFLRPCLCLDKSILDGTILL